MAQAVADGASSPESHGAATPSVPGFRPANLPNEFLLKALNLPTDRRFLLRLDEELTHFIDRSAEATLRFPAMNPYQRRLVHQVADYFGLVHVTETIRNGPGTPAPNVFVPPGAPPTSTPTATATCVVVSKTDCTVVPPLRLVDLVEEEEPPKQTFKIMKRVSRPQPATAAEAQADDSAPSQSALNSSPELGGAASPTMPSASIASTTTAISAPEQTATDKPRRFMSLEEREAAYERARAKIFADQPSSPSSDEGTKVSSKPHSTPLPTEKPHGSDHRSRPTHKGSVRPRSNPPANQPPVRPPNAPQALESGGGPRPRPSWRPEAPSINNARTAPMPINRPMAYPSPHPPPPAQPMPFAQLYQHAPSIPYTRPVLPNNTFPYPTNRPYFSPPAPQPQSLPRPFAAAYQCQGRPGPQLPLSHGPQLKSTSEFPALNGGGNPSRPAMASRPQSAWANRPKPASPANTGANAAVDQAGLAAQFTQKLTIQPNGLPFPNNSQGSNTHKQPLSAPEPTPPPSSSSLSTTAATESSLATSKLLFTYGMEAHDGVKESDRPKAITHILQMTPYASGDTLSDIRFPHGTIKRVLLQALSTDATASPVYLVVFKHSGHAQTALEEYAGHPRLLLTRYSA
ncbi:hypothetical protein H4R35_003866 [Dimargaris xerosporica]|nr:hypothetical protein H4R35_003866 [Dimargaris xerosporica]